MMALEGQSAEAYDQTSEQQGEMGIELLAEATLTSGGTVLDLGCGTGQLSCVLAEKVGPNGRVVAVDPDKERLALAREKHRRSNIEYLEADDQTFPIDQYDLIFLNMVIHWIHNKKELFERVFNCLKPGGQLAFNTADGKPELPPIYDEFLQTVIGPKFANYFYGEKMEILCSSDYEKLARDQGFVIVSMKTKVQYRDWPLTVDGLLETLFGLLQGDLDPSSINMAAVDQFKNKYGEEPFESVPDRNLFVVLTKP